MSTASEANVKPDNRGLECQVLDEFLVVESKQRSNGQEKTESSEKKEENPVNGTGKNKGQKPKRPVYKFDRKKQLCSAYIDMPPGSEDGVCKFDNCKFSHDYKAFVENKPPDLGSECYMYNTFGYCPRGLTCRYSGQHTDGNYRNLKNTDIYTGEPQECNQLKKDVQIKLRKKEYNFAEADHACNVSFEIMRRREGAEKGTKDVDGATENDENENVGEPKAKQPKIERIGCVTDEDIIKLKPKEKKKLDWKDKLYLAPLTTVGNLPYRRLCKKLGADITCSEMALGLPLLQGAPAEWALVKRHKSEDFFGIQVCGCSPPQMSRVAQLIEENVDCDFVDINMGCPIDLIYKKGMGSGLMVRNRPVEIISRTMASIMSRPLTIKMRTGVYKDKNIAHLLFPKLQELGVSALTIHGRSREQRYTKLADWEYIGECKKTVDIPVFGNGDILNYEDYYAMKENSGVDGIMLARGALIKPWIFTEIKERRHWDISGQERLDIIKDFANFGMEHWGSDDKGLETTRKFLLEWLSFTYRYAPFGILKSPPQRINERLPMYRGRNDIETLLSSPNCQDWVKITEMFLGKVKDDFQFIPKHKANSYS